MPHAAFLQLVGHLGPGAQQRRPQGSKYVRLIAPALVLAPTTPALAPAHPTLVPGAMFETLYQCSPAPRQPRPSGP